MARLKEKYNAEVAPALMKQFGYKSVMQIPKIDKVVINVGCGEARENSKVLVAMPSENKVIVEKVNVATCHTKPRRQGEAGGIVKRETPIRACKVALYCEKCGKGVRVGYNMADGKKTRVCRKCGAEI